MIPASIEARFGFTSRSLRAIADAVRRTALAHCEERGFAYIGRTKTASSLFEKIESGRYQRWSDLDDLFGCAIVIPTLADEPDVLQYLRGVFEEVETKLRSRPKKAPDVFRFDATRFLGRLKQPLDIAEFENLIFEVQIRTAFEHAWSVTTHALTYKSNVVDWRRLRLTAQLKASVEQLDLLVAGFDAASSHIEPYLWLDVEAKRQVVEYFEGLFGGGRLPSEVRPKDLGRFAENLVNAINVRPGKGAEQLWAERLAAIKRLVEKVEAARVPRSISLFQFVLSEAARDGTIGPSERAALPITREVLDLYPHMKTWRPVFDLAG